MKINFQFFLFLFGTVNLSSYAASAPGGPIMGRASKQTFKKNKQSMMNRLDNEIYCCDKIQACTITCGCVTCMAAWGATTAALSAKCCIASGLCCLASLCLGARMEKLEKQRERLENSQPHNN